MARTNVFVKFLPPYFDDGQLHSLFSSFGSILSVKVMLDQGSNVSLGFGFVRFEKEEDAKQAIEAMSGHRIGQKVLMCKLSDSFCFPAPAANVYIKPLPLGYTTDDLQLLFGKFGQILTVKVVDNVGIADSVIGFVNDGDRYDTVKSATLAVEQMNNMKLFPELPNLHVKYAESDMERATRKSIVNPPRKPIIQPKATTIHPETNEKETNNNYAKETTNNTFFSSPSYLTSYSQPTYNYSSSYPPSYSPSYHPSSSFSHTTVTHHYNYPTIYDNDMQYGGPGPNQYHYTVAYIPMQVPGQYNPYP